MADETTEQPSPAPPTQAQPAPQQEPPPPTQDSPADYDTNGLLKSDVIAQRMRVGSTAIVEDIYKHAMQEVKDVETRAGRLDTKATTLVSSTNLALTVAFTFGASTLVQHPEMFKGLRWVVGIELAAVALTGFASSVFGILALSTSENLKVLNEKVLFDPALLHTASAGVMEDSTGDDAKAEEASAAAIYRRTLTEHLWGVSQTNFIENQRRARLIGKGQIAFLMFLLSVAVFGATVASFALRKTAQEERADRHEQRHQTQGPSPHSTPASRGTEDGGRPHEPLQTR